MSAYVVSDKTITAIVTAMQRKHFSTDLQDPETGITYNARTNPQMYGQLLLNENYRSVNYRYGEDTKPRRFQMAYNVTESGYRDDFTFAEMYGSIMCYMYQTCETPDWIGSDIYFAMCHLKDDLAEKMLEKLGEEMRWGV